MKLTADLRTIEGKKVKNLRAQGLVPASIYGPKRKSTNIQVDKKDFIKLFKSVGFNKFFDLDIEGDAKTSKVLVKEIQKQPITDLLTSVSFYQIDDDTKLTVEVPVELVGEAPAVKLNVGFLIQSLDQIELHCLPKDVPASIQIDISTLENIGDGVSVGDIKLAEGVELSSSMDESSSIVSIAAPQKEEEPEPVAEAVEGEGEAAPAEGESSGEKKEDEAK